MTPADLFHRAGVALFGDQYVAPLAVALGVPKNTVGKWRDGKSTVPPGVWRQVREMASDRAVELATVAGDIFETMPADYD